MLHDIYQRLLQRYGNQGWWPLIDTETPVEDDRDFQMYLKHVPDGDEEDFRNHWPRHTGPRIQSDEQRFEVLVGTFLTQNTSWSNAERALYNLSRQDLLRRESLRAAPHTEVAEAITPARYMNQKTRYLQEFCAFLEEHPLEELRGMETAPLRKLLLAQRGVGPETADSMLLYAFERPVFVIDAYTIRILSRYGHCDHDIKYHQLQDTIMAALEKDVELFKEYHALLVRHAQEHCRTRPLCETCPLKECERHLQ